MVTATENKVSSQISYLEARRRMLEEGKVFTRQAYGECRILRAATDGDVDFINYDPKGLIVEDCRRRVCDCKVVIWQQTSDDQLAEDYEEVFDKTAN